MTLKAGVPLILVGFLYFVSLGSGFIAKKQKIGFTVIYSATFMDFQHNFVVQRIFQIKRSDITSKLKDKQRYLARMINIKNDKQSCCFEFVYLFIKQTLCF